MGEQCLLLLLCVRKTHMMWAAGLCPGSAALTCSMCANLQHRRPGKPALAFPGSDWCLGCSSRLRGLLKWNWNVDSSASRVFGVAEQSSPGSLLGIWVEDGADEGSQHCRGGFCCLACVGICVMSLPQRQTVIWRSCFSALPLSGLLLSIQMKYLDLSCNASSLEEYGLNVWIVPHALRVVALVSGHLPVDKLNLVQHHHTRKHLNKING